MGIFSSGASESRKVRELLARQYRENKATINDAMSFAEEQVNPYMLDPSVMNELQAVVTGGPVDYMKSPIYQRYYDAGRDALMEDMAGTGMLYSGVRMEGIRDMGQQAFGQYMNTLSSLAGFGRDTASQLGGIRMQGANALVGAGNQYAGDVANVRMAQSANERGLGLGLLNLGASFAGGMMGAG